MMRDQNHDDGKRSERAVDIGGWESKYKWMLDAGWKGTSVEGNPMENSLARHGVTCKQVARTGGLKSWASSATGRGLESAARTSAAGGAVCGVDFG
jgi:hypothetical protein